MQEINYEHALTGIKSELDGLISATTIAGRVSEINNLLTPVIATLDEFSAGLEVPVDDLIELLDELRKRIAGLRDNPLSCGTHDRV